MARGYLGTEDFQYFGIYEKIVAMFALILMDIHVEVNGKKIRVPVNFSPREKFLSYIIRTGRDGKLGMSSVLPMIGYESTSMYPDEERIKNQFNPLKNRHPLTKGEELISSNRTPYNTDFKVHIACKNIKEGAMIFEQIIPAFRPSMTFKLKDLPQYGIESDVEVILTGAEPSYEYTGGFEDVRVIVYEFGFTVKHFYYCPIEKSERIKHAVLNLGDEDVKNILTTVTKDVVPEEATQYDEHEIVTKVTDE